MVKYILID